MKTLLVFALIILTSNSRGQNNKLIISGSGFDSIKMGMTKLEVEDVIKMKLQPFVVSDSLLRGTDTNLKNSYCKDCAEYYDGKYKDANIRFSFSRNSRDSTSNFELASVSVSSPTKVIETNYGIRTGLTEKEFIQICKRNKYVYFEAPKNWENKTYGFYKNQEAAEVLIFSFSKGIISTIAVMNRVSD